MPAFARRRGGARGSAHHWSRMRAASPRNSRRVNPRQRLLSFACAKLAVTASCLRSLRTRPPVCSMRHREPHEGEVSEVLPWLHSAAGSHRGARHIRDQCSAPPRAPLPRCPRVARGRRHLRERGSKDECVIDELRAWWCGRQVRPRERGVTWQARERGALDSTVRSDAVRNRGKCFY